MTNQIKTRRNESPQTAPRRLRQLLEDEGVFLCPGVTNPYDARVAERVGFEMIYSTGAGIANSVFGYPDLGLLSMNEVFVTTRRIVSGVDIPVLADIDTGYGGAMNVFRTVREFADAGVAAVQIEDQTSPKRCGHFDGKDVVSQGEMAERLIAAVEARGDGDLVLIARTDAAATLGVAEAIRRAQIALEAGADIVFVEAPTTKEDIARIPKEVNAPLILNVVEGGKTPLLSLDELASLGYRIALYANTAMRVGTLAVERALRTLLRDGDSAALQNEMLTWDQRQNLAQIDEWMELDASISARVERVLPQDGDSG